MPPIVKKINAPAIATKVFNAKSRAGDAKSIVQTRLRAKRDDLMAARNTPEAKGRRAKADESRKAATFKNNLAAQRVVKGAEETRKAALFNNMAAASKPSRAPAAQARPSKAMQMRVARRGKY